MFGKYLQAGVALLLITACAQPKYVQANDGPASSPDPQQKAECGVSFKKSGYCLSWQWEEKPTSSARGSFIFKIYRQSLLDGSAIVLDMPVTPEVQLWMPGMGHGSTPVQVQRVDVGGYRASEVFFIMPGEWEIRIQLKEGSVVQDEAVVSLTF